MSTQMEDIQEIVFAREELAAIVARLGRQISQDYQGKNLLLVGILRGALPFLADLMREISIPCQMDCMMLSSYGDSAHSSGKVNMKLDVTLPVKGMDVLIVEDIVETGITLHYLLQLFQARGAGSVKICALLDKPGCRKVELSAQYVGAYPPNAFLVGYGMDYAQKYRNLPYIGVLKPEIYQDSSQPAL